MLKMEPNARNAASKYLHNILFILGWLMPSAVAAAGSLVILSSAPVGMVTPADLARVAANPQFSGERAYGRLVEFVTANPDRDTQSPASRSAAIWARDRFQAMGLKAWVEEYRHPFPSQNLVMDMLFKPLAVYADKKPGWHAVAVLPGEVNEWILVGGHLDITPESVEGAVDNGTGVASVMELADIFRGRAHHYGFLFVLFDGEEPPLAGSLGFPASHPEFPLRHVLIIDSIGGIGGDTVNPAPVSRNGAAPVAALSLLAAAAKAEGLSFSIAYTEFDAPLVLETILDRTVGFAETDTGSFYGFADTVIGMASWGDAEDALNGPKDSLSLVNPDLFGRAGRAAERYLLALDDDRIGSAGDDGYAFAVMPDGRIGLLPGVWVNAALAVIAAACLFSLCMTVFQARVGFANFLPSFTREVPLFAFIVLFPFFLSFGLTVIRPLPFALYLGLCSLWVPAAFVLVPLRRRKHASELDPDGRLFDRQKLIGAFLTLATSLVWLAVRGPFGAVLAATPSMLITLPIGYNSPLGRIASRIAVLATSACALAAGILLAAMAYFDVGFHALAFCLGLALLTATQGVYGFSSPQRQTDGRE